MVCCTEPVDWCGDWIHSRSCELNTMKARQPEFRAIPQFDSGRWKWRLERVPVDPDNETAMGMDFDSAAQASVNETNERIGSRYRSNTADANDKHPVGRIGRSQRLAKTGANNSKPVPAESFKPMITPKR